MYEFKGKHLLAEFYNIDVGKLNDPLFFLKVLEEGIKKANVTKLSHISKKFEPQGFTLLVLLAESHISIHTYPEKQSFFMDVFTCGDKNPNIILDYLKEEINYGYINQAMIERGGKNEKVL